MDVGVYLPQVAFTWEDLRARVVECDRAGIGSLWLMDHLYPPTLPRVPSFEAWTTATALAAVTERIRIGHLVLANAFRHPALLAKMAVTLDHVSGGRLNLGLGSGSYAPEFREAGVPFGSEAARAAALDEALTIVRRLFTDEVVAFEGAHYTLAGLPSLPRPLQTPHPPIHVGGAGPRRTLPLVARHADVWNCPTYALDALVERRAALDAECARIGRDPASLRTTEEAVLALVARADQVEEARAAALRRFAGPGWRFDTHGYCGTPDDVLRRLETRRRDGVDGVVFFLHDRGAPETIRLLAEEIVPAARRL
jgi:alkanesulfonate monooxygenase SsuD/methylene tetrahydromethanopterin reductase-like flavin-dependent oxidoreductase (luciferase family)